VKVRRAYVKGRYNPPKTRHGRRDVPISHDLVVELRRHRAHGEHPGDGDLVFCAPDGRPPHDRNLSGRMLKPLAQEIGAPWMGWYTLRHTCASMLFAGGRNAVQVQRWLGHSQPWVHAGDLCSSARRGSRRATRPGRGNGPGCQRVSARPPATAVNAVDALSDETGVCRGIVRQRDIAGSAREDAKFALEF
jgi:hypothetical protein